MNTTDAPVLRVLVAEDDPDHRFLFSRELRKAAPLPMEIWEAEDGQQALDRLHGRGAYEGAGPPHVVFLDIRMPRVSGLEVLERIRSDPDLSAIPVVVLTSSDRNDDIDTAYLLGTNSYVTKAKGRRPLQETLAKVAEYWTVSNQLPTPRGGATA